MPFADIENGLRLYYDERGSGDPLLLIMGIGAQSILWPDGFCDALAERGYRVIRFDNRDVGESSYLDGVQAPPPLPVMARMLAGAPVHAPYALEDMATDTVQLLDHLKIERAHVVGASMGGMIAQLMAIMYPERLRSLVSVMSTTGRASVRLTSPHAVRALLQPAPRNEDEAAERSVKFFGAVAGRGFPFDAEMTAARGRMSFRRGNNPAGFLRQLAAIAATGDRTARLRFVRTPTLVIHGSDDPLIRPMGGRWTADAIPDAKLSIVDGLGHDFPKAAWSQVGDLIDNHAKELG